MGTGIVSDTKGRWRGWRLPSPLKLGLETPILPKLGERDLRGVPSLSLPMIYIC